MDPRRLQVDDNLWLRRTPSLRGCSVRRRIYTDDSCTLAYSTTISANIYILQAETPLTSTCCEHVIQHALQQAVQHIEHIRNEIET